MPGVQQMARARSFYEVLAVPQDAQAEEIRAAFKRQALRVHPDKGGSKEAFQAVYCAFETLAAETSRRAYDARLARQLCGAWAGPVAAGPPGGRASSLRRAGRAAAGTKEAPEATEAAEGEAQAEAAPAEREASRRRRPQGGEAQGAGARAEEATARPDTAAGKRSGPPVPPPRTEQGRRGMLGRNLLAMLHGHLIQLSPARRRWVLQRYFSEAQRLALEAWIVERRREDQTTSGNGDAIVVASTNRAMHCAGGHPVFAAESLMRTAMDAHCDEIPDYDESERSCNASASALHLLPPLAGASDQSGASGESTSNDDSTSEEDDAFGMPLAMAGTHAGADACYPYGHLVPFPSMVGCSNEGGHARTTVRGIATMVSKGTWWYRASVGVDNIIIMARDVKELPAALDFLVILTATKQYAAADTDNNVQLRFERALHRAAADRPNVVKEMELRYMFRVRQSYWVGRRQLSTPRFDDLCAFSYAWHRLAPFHVQNKRGRGGVLWRMGPDELYARWLQFKEIFADACEVVGVPRMSILARLEELAAEHQGHRESLLRYWEREHMCQEDAQGRRERLLPKRGRAEERLLRRIHWLSRRWQRQEHREARRRARQAAAVAAAVASVARARGRQEQQRRKAWWRRMHRRDITMEELLGARFGSGAAQHA